MARSFGKSFFRSMAKTSNAIGSQTAVDTARALMAELMNQPAEARAQALHELQVKGETQRQEQERSIFPLKKRAMEAELMPRAEPAPSGYRYKADKTLEPIPGGPEATKAKAREDAAAVKRRAFLTSGANVLRTIDGAIGKVGINTAGMGSLMRKVPGSDATDLEADIATIKANLSKDALKEMRESSTSGASGLGALSERELTMLESTVASLDQRQSPAQLREKLKKVREHYANWMKTLGPQSVGRFQVEIE